MFIDDYHKYLTGDDDDFTYCDKWVSDMYISNTIDILQSSSYLIFKMRWLNSEYKCDISRFDDFSSISKKFCNYYFDAIYLKVLSLFFTDDILFIFSEENSRSYLLAKKVCLYCLVSKINITEKQIFDFYEHTKLIAIKYVEKITNELIDFEDWMSST